MNAREPSSGGSPHKESNVKHKALVVLIAVIAMTLGSVGATSAITWGEPDGEAHPYVGMLVSDAGGVPTWRCSGTLIAPTVFLTAAHCVYGTDAARVWFDTDLSDNPEYPYGGETSVEGVPYAHPDYDGVLLFPNPSDLGIVILDEPVTDRGLGALPSIGLAEELNVAPGSEVMVNVVGYGYQAVKPEKIDERVRYQATPMLVEVNSPQWGDWNIHVSSNPGEGGGTGGSCYGDSGGPALISTESNVILGVGSSMTNSMCRGIVYYYRVDTAYAQEWISQFLP
jgi:hypothetical protein